MRRFFHLVVLASAGFMLWGLLVEGPGLEGGGSEADAAAESPAAEARRVREQEALRLPTEREKSTQRDLEAQVRAELQWDHLVKTDGRIVRGRILAESPTSIRLLQTFGSTGQMEVTIPRSEVRELVRNSAKPPPVRFRDVRFKLEMPGMKFYRRPPFTVISDQDFFRVSDAVSLLEGLNVEITRMFAPLITRPERNDGIQLLFFSRAGEYNAYRKQHARELSYASGFYSVTKDRLVVFDQETSKWAREATREVNKMKAVHHRKASRHRDLVGLERWHNAATGSIAAVAEQANRAILRHEGAHQLFFNYGVHSEHGAEHPWLIEGLASFCEEGFASSGQRAEEARGRKRRSTFAALVDFESMEDFGALAANGRQGSGGSSDAVGDAYAQSWFLVHHLMRNHRVGFFEYIRFVRDPANAREIATTPRFVLLSRLVERAPKKLERELQLAHAKL